MKLCLLCIPLVALTFLASAQKGGDKKPESPNMADMMAAMQKAGTPGAQHKALDGFVGTWSAKVSMWMDPSAPATESTGTMVTKWIYGGRYLEQKFEGDMMGQKFEGTSLWGYDIAAGNYVGIWIDSMGTAISSSTGGMSKDGKSFTMSNTCTDPMTGKPATGEEVIKIDSPTSHSMTMYETKDGKKVKSMEIVYTKK